MAGRYPPQWLDQLRERADIVNVVGSYVTLKKNGHRYVGLCPFHNETAPSFSVDETKQFYYCFGCKAGGSVIQFIMDIEHMSFQEAVEFLADRVHLPLPELQSDPEYEKRRSLKERIYMANKAAAALYHEKLWKPEAAHILQYLQKRGLSDAVIRRFGIGAALPAGGIVNELLKQGFSEEELLQAGLSRKSENGLFDMFRNRAIFPIIDAYGNVLGFGGRAMGDAMPKYLNTADTPAFNKRYNVFAANLLRKAKNLSRVILVEGYMDVVALSQFGIEGVAATLGTALTPEQSRLLHRFAPEVILAYDGDAAGQKAILRGLEILETEGVPARVLVFPDKLDPDEFLRQKGVEAFQNLKPLSAVSYRLLRAKDSYDLGTEEGRTQYAKECGTILKTLKEPVELDAHIRRLALETGFSTEVLYKQVGVSKEIQQKNAEKKESFSKQAKSLSAVDWNARLLLAVLASGKLPSDIISPDEFTDDLLRSICESIQAGVSLASVLEQMPDEQGRSVLSDVLSIDTDVEDESLMKMARDCLYKLRRERLEKELDLVQKRLPSLPQSEREAENRHAARLLKQLQDLHS